DQSASACEIFTEVPRLRDARFASGGIVGVGRGVGESLFVAREQITIRIIAPILIAVGLIVAFAGDISPAPKAIAAGEQVVPGIVRVTLPVWAIGWRATEVADEIARLRTGVRFDKPARMI